MKKTDIAIIIFIIGISAGIAYFVAHSVFGNMSQTGVKVKTVDPITSAIGDPDPKIFNSDSINPSVEVNITDTGSSTDTTTNDTTTSTSTNTNAAGTGTTKTP